MTSGDRTSPQGSVGWVWAWLAIRFLLVTFLALIPVTCFARIFSPAFDRGRPDAPEDFWQDAIAAACVWTVALVVSAVDLIRQRRNLRRKVAQL